ncbi:MAG: hypothetical protein HY014_07140 [Acidobacteria bacterium]|nr:hypothetical protein [Acidobacteriota bacterium]MBI3487927.1 hypothetical protein [Acidobacteriota bacterium]
MTPHHLNHLAAAAISPASVGPAVRLVVGLVTIPAVLIISGEVGAP